MHTSPALWKRSWNTIHSNLYLQEGEKSRATGWFFNNNYKKKTLQDRKTLPKVHLIGCWGVKLFLPKDFLKFCQKWSCHNLIFWVLSQFEIRVLSQFEFFAFCHNLSFWVFSQFGFCHNLSFWVVTFSVFGVWQKFEFLSL